MKINSIIVLLLVMPVAVSASDRAPIVDTETEYVVSSPTPTNFKPSERDIDEAISAFDTFQNFRDRGKLSDAYAMLTDSNQQVTPWKDWEQTQKSSQQNHGADLSRQIFRISWYPNPPSADQSGIYVALDFASATQKYGFRCGYVILLQKPATPLRIVRTDDTYIPKDLVDGKLPRPDVTTKLPCYLGKTIRTSFPNVEK